VKEGARYRGLVIYRRGGEDEQIAAAHELASFWLYAGALVDAQTERLPLGKPSARIQTSGF
jgi:hypothetical protein